MGLKCAFPGCAMRVAPDRASVPEVGTICRAEKKNTLSSKDLFRYVHCPVHASRVRKNGVKMYQYLATMQMLKRRERKRKATQKRVTTHLHVPMPETAMGNALRKAGVVGRSGCTPVA